jgi:2-polyprenyl-3-methyl-5-hydroxy-6-metoxy-1,4-benzoquinol methylase
MTISPMPALSYPINEGATQTHRDDSLNLIFDPHSLNFFPFDSLKNNDKILFAGCGNGELVIAIAKELLRRQITVEIVAFDLSHKQLECAKAYARESGIDHIHWELQDARDLKKYCGQFNVVHARFLLNQVANAHLVTQNLCEALAKDGIFIGEEFSGINVDVLGADPEHLEAVKQWERIVRLQHIIQKSDASFAERLPKILSDNALLITQYSQPEPKADYALQKQIFPSYMDRALIICPNDEHENINRIKTALEFLRDQESCSITFKHFTQIQALKRDWGHH